MFEIRPALAEVLKPLIPVQYNINAVTYMEGEIPTIYGLLYGVSFSFDEKVDVKDGTYGSILCDGNIVAEAEVIKSKPSKSVTVYFDELKLPKGKDYKLLVPANTIFLSENPDIKAEELMLSFHVGDKFPAYVDKSWETRISKQGDSFEFSFRTETMGNDGVIFLYRAGLPIMSFPLVPTHADIGLGIARCEFGRKLNFEKGIDYSFVLPEGSVHSFDRNDIVNLEAHYDFIGAYDKTFAPIDYVACSVEGQKNITTLGEVSVDYTTSIMLAPNAHLQLVDGSGDVVAVSAAELAEEDGMWHLTADFGGFGLDADEKYSLCVPEATVVGAGSDITINQRTLVPINEDATLIETLYAMCPHIDLCNGQMVVSGLERGSHIYVYNSNGTLIGKMYTEAYETRMTLPSSSMYIVKVNDKTYKVR